MLKGSLGANQTFGWAPKHYQLTKDILFNGQLCESGIGVPLNDLNSSHTLVQNISGFYDNRPNGLCVEVLSVKTDVGVYDDFENDVPECYATDPGSYCEYSYRYGSRIKSFKLRC